MRRVRPTACVSAAAWSAADQRRLQPDVSPFLALFHEVISLYLLKLLRSLPGVTLYRITQHPRLRAC